MTKVLIVVPHVDFANEMRRMCGPQSHVAVCFPGQTLTGRRFDQIIVFGDSFIRGRAALATGSAAINDSIREWLCLLTTKLSPGGTIQYLGGRSEP